MRGNGKSEMRNSGWSNPRRSVHDSRALQATLREYRSAVAGTHSAGSWTLFLLVCVVLFFLVNCASESGPLRPEAARAELQRKGVDYGARAFVESAKNDDQDTLKLFLDAGMDPDARGDSGSTALMQVAYAGNEQALEMLLARGAKVSLTDDDGLTALHWAARGPYGYKCVSTLLKHGGDSKARSHSGNTPLHEAIILPSPEPSVAFLLKNYVDTTATLLDNGADVNAKNDRGVSVLMRAATFGSLQIVRLLVDRGADVRALDNERRTARMYALQYGHDEAARIIEQAGG